tara:strand:- start:412952 stop:413515 length:564 start_codon:yes stop_codon:yes gene_type:complete
MRLLLLTALLITPALLFAAPGLPHQLHGTVEDFTSGTLNVFINDVNVGSAAIQSDGTFGKSPNLFFVADEDGAYAGERMTFKINAADAEGNVTFVNGAVTEVATRLVIIGRDTPSGTTQTTTPAPVSVPTPTTTTTTPIKGDFGGDGVVDVNDFNYFIANWGSPETDLNGDGVTDILDFNILMANWK